MEAQKLGPTEAVNNEESKSLLIPLIRCIYDSQSPLPLMDHAEAILEDIRLFYLYPQIYILLKNSERISELSERFRQELEAGYLRTLGQSHFFRQKEKELSALLEKHQIEAIVLKGARFAERYFGHFTARTSSDIDLLVRKSRFQDAIEALKQEGYVHEMTVEHHARIVKNRFLVELHWTLDIPTWSDLHENAWWQSAVSIAPHQYIKELSPLHTLYFICLHGARHQMNSVRYLLDVVQVLTTHSAQIDMAELMEMARADRTARRIQAVLSIVYSQFPFLHKVKPLPFPMVQTPWNYEIIRKGCLGEKSLSYYQYKLYFRHFMFDTWKHRFQSIRKPY
jgi:hypothetical protein